MAIGELIRGLKKKAGIKDAVGGGALLSANPERSHRPSQNRWTAFARNAGRSSRQPFWRGTGRSSWRRPARSTASSGTWFIPMPSSTRSANAGPTRTVTGILNPQITGAKVCPDDCGLCDLHISPSGSGQPGPDQPVQPALPHLLRQRQRPGLRVRAHLRAGGGNAHAWSATSGPSSLRRSSFPGESRRFIRASWTSSKRPPPWVSAICRSPRTASGSPKTRSSPGRPGRPGFTPFTCSSTARGTRSTGKPAAFEASGI